MRDGDLSVRRYVTHLGARTIPDYDTKIELENAALRATVARIHGLVVEWKTLRDGESDDDFGKERASKLDDCIEDLEFALKPPER